MLKFKPIKEGNQTIKFNSLYSLEMGNASALFLGAGDANKFAAALNAGDELAEAAKEYLVAYKNEDKEPGWIKRVDAARQRLLKAIEGKEKIYV